MSILTKPRALQLTAILIIIVCGIIPLLLLTHHNFYRDRKFSYYTNQFYAGQYISGNQIIEALGPPNDIQYFHQDDIPANPIEYIEIHYDGFTFGILDSTLDGTIVMIDVVKSGVIKLRGGIDIGSQKNALERAYQYEHKMGGAYGFILGKDHQVADGGGIWIYVKFSQEDGSISEIVITNGL